VSVHGLYYAAFQFLFLTWSCLLGLLSVHFPAMFLYAFFWLQALLYWFLVTVFGLVSHAIIWYHLRDFWFNFSGAVL
jgi:hypothetical protein